MQRIFTSFKSRPHQQQFVEATMLNATIVKRFFPFDKVECYFDKVDCCFDNVESCFDIFAVFGDNVERIF